MPKLASTASLSAPVFSQSPGTTTSVRRKETILAGPFLPSVAADGFGKLYPSFACYALGGRIIPLFDGFQMRDPISRSCNIFTFGVKLPQLIGASRSHQIRHIA